MVPSHGSTTLVSSNVKEILSPLTKTPLHKTANEWQKKTRQKVKEASIDVRTGESGKKCDEVIPSH